MNKPTVSLFPVNPERLVQRAARPIFEELVAVLEEIAASLEEGDLRRAECALEKARQIDERVGNFEEALSAGRDTARISPTYRRTIEHLELYATARARIDLTVINGRILARGAANAVRHGDPLPAPIPEAVRLLAQSVRALAAYLEESEELEVVHRCALEAAERASALLKKPHNLATSMLVGQIRSAVVDILRSTGMDQASAVLLLEEVAGRATEIG